MTRFKQVLQAGLLLLLVAACGSAMPTATSTATSSGSATPSPDAAPLTPGDQSTGTIATIQAEPTITAVPGDEHAVVDDLPLGKAGHYVNVAYGYRLQYPTEWYTGFGNRPVLVSFSNLDPGTHNRLSMRADGCLVEIQASANVFGLTIEDLRAQMPRTFTDAEAFDLQGEPALLIREPNEQTPFKSEWVLVQRGGRWFRISVDYGRDMADLCHTAWEDLLSSWQWFEPDFVVYANVDYGYAISHPRRWYRFNARQQGISIASQDPANVGDLESFLQGAMLVSTDVFENSEGMSLKDWLAAQDQENDLTNDIPLDQLVGVRVLRDGPTADSQEMAGYFQGPLGKIYAVTCLYPSGRQWEFRPVANGIIYSFSF